ALGWALATLAFSLFFSVLPAPIAWRALFFVGILPALLVLYVRARMSEPAVFLTGHTPDRTARRGTSLVAIFAPRVLPTLGLASLLSVGVQGAYYALVIWLPTYLSSVRHLSALNTGGYLLILIAGSFVGYLCGAFSMDRFGRRAALIVFALLSA